MIHFREAGEGPPVVLLHGLFGSLENLGGIARVLAESFHVHSLDLPNHGRSRHVASMPLAAMAEAVRAWMAQQNLGSASLVGHSLGGKVAMELAMADPAAVSRIAVLDIAPAAYGVHHARVFEGLEAIDLSSLQDRQHADVLLSPFVDETVVRSFLLKNLTRQGSAFSWRMNLAALIEDYPQLIAANRAGCFDAPCLFIKGASSDYIQPHHEREIRSRFPRAKLKVVPGAGHWLHAEKPALVARLLNTFLQADDHQNAAHP